MCLCLCVKHDHAYVPLVINTFRSFPHSWIITGFVSRLTRRVSLVEEELLTFPEHLSSAPVFIGVRVTRSLALCVCFVERCLSCCLFSFGHCVVCPSNYGYWLPRWYLQIPLATIAPITHYSIFTQTVGSSCYPCSIFKPFLHTTHSFILLHFCCFAFTNCYFVFSPWLVGSLRFTDFVLFTLFCLDFEFMYRFFVNLKVYF